MWRTLLTFLTLFTFSLCNTNIFNEKNNITRKDPSFPFTGEMFTGFIVIDNTTQANLYYHLYAFNQTETSTQAPLIIWLEGGPGCSSAFGNYVQFGPVTIDKDNSSNFHFGNNPFTWNQYAHILYIDQPTGTGFSQANGLNVSSTVQSSKHFQTFLARFYQLFPEMMKHPLYLVGESYAGKYIPVYTHDLLNNATFTSQVTIKGIAIGDGWSDPIRQMPTYGSFGYVAGMIDGRNRDNLRLQEVQGVLNILKGDYYDATNISNSLLAELTALAGGVSNWNYREFDESDDPYADWLSTKEAQDFLGVPYQDYEDCSQDISDDFYGDNTQSVAHLYPELFERLPVLIYTGQDDENVDYEGTINYINALNWKDIKNFRNSQRTVWKLSNGTKAGLVKGYGNLTFLLLFKCGHLVPADQPRSAFEMIYNFLHNIPFF